MDDFPEEEELYLREGPDMVAEAKAFERVGPSGKLSELLSAPATSGDKKANLTPEDRFLIAVDAVSRRLAGENIAKISEADINLMLEKTSLVTGLRYKNPVGYILGFLASEGGKSTLSVEHVKYIIQKVLPDVATEAGLSPADVVRYARYWSKFL